MTKRIICWLLGLALPCMVLGQKADTSFFSAKKRLELGINITSVISNFVGATEDNVMTPGDYPLTFKYLFSPTSALRAGLGGKALNRREVIDPTQQQPFPQTLISRDNAVNTRLGYERRWILGKRWMTYLGADALLGYLLTQSSATAGGEVVLTRTQGYQVGVGPVYGLQFAIAPRLHLGFEGSLYGFMSNGTVATTFVNFPELSTKKTFQDASAFLSVPKWLYLIARF